MKQIKLCRLEAMGEGDMSFYEAWEAGEPVFLVGEPSPELLEMEIAGWPILAELRYLQGRDEEYIAQALCLDETVKEYTNVCIDAFALPQAYLRRIYGRWRGKPVVIAETERLLIRESVPEDCADFAALYEDEDCRRFLAELPLEGLENSLRDRAENGQGAERPAVRSDVLAAYKRYIAQYSAGQYAFYEYGMWSLIEKESGRFVGRGGLEQLAGDVTDDKSSAEGMSLGYAILPEYRGKGYATEACLAILDYCAECEYADRVYVTIDEDNAASLRVFDKLAQESATREGLPRLVRIRHLQNGVLNRENV